MKYYILLPLLTTLGCATMGPIKSAMSSDAIKINNVMNNLPSHEVQVLFSEVIRHKNGQVSFKEDQFQLDDNNYFYPASSVKLPIALLALEKLHESKVLNRNTPYQVEGDSLISTFAKDIIDIFAVSSNSASNRLFEFMGQDDINRRLNTKGIPGRISHRLSTPNSGDLVTKSLSFYNNDEVIFKTMPINNLAVASLHLNRITKGKGYIRGDSLIHQPMDFSDKNYLPISSLHGILKRLLFPDLFPKEQQFHLSEEDRQFVIHTMGIVPSDAGYTSEDYYDSYDKFLVIGDSKNTIPEHLKIYNKVGYAYGYLTDSAYIIDSTTQKEYLITATIHVNKNEIYNDGVYEYQDVGIPFLAALGRKLIMESD